MVVAHSVFCVMRQSLTTINVITFNSPYRLSLCRKALKKAFTYA